MANRYVRTDGSDSNDGTADDAGHAWLTVDHGYASISDGDTLNIGPGTYIGHGGTFAGAVELNRNFGSPTILQATNGDPSATLIQGSGASNYNFVQTAAIGFTTFRNLTLRSPAVGTQPTPQSVFRFRGGNSAHLLFDGCLFSANSGLAGSSYFCYTDGDHVDHTFLNTVINHTGSNDGTCKIWTIIGGTLSGLSLLGNHWHSTAGVIVDWPSGGATGLVLLGGAYVNTNPVNAATPHALRVGADEITGPGLSGARVEGAYLYAKSTHAALFGARTGGAIARLNLCVSDYDIALVNKENAGSLIENNVLVSSGTQANSGGLTNKGVWDCVIRGNWCIGNGSASGYALGMYQGDSPTFRPCRNNAVYGNRLTALGPDNQGVLLGAVGMTPWVSATDFQELYPSWFDQNWFDLQGGATNLGQVNNVADRTSLAQVQAAWGGFNSGNDLYSSLSGVEVTFAHATTTELIYGILTGPDPSGPQFWPWGASAVRLGELPGDPGTFRWAVPPQYAGAGSFSLRVYTCSVNGYKPDPGDTLLATIPVVVP